MRPVSGCRSPLTFSDTLRAFAAPPPPPRRLRAVQTRGPAVERVGDVRMPRSEGALGDVERRRRESLRVLVASSTVARIFPRVVARRGATGVQRTQQTVPNLRVVGSISILIRLGGGVQRA